MKKTEHNSMHVLEIELKTSNMKLVDHYLHYGHASIKPVIYA